MGTRWLTPGQLADLLGRSTGPGPAYQELADRVRVLIVDGRLSPDVRMPSERALAQVLGLSRTTVSAAYERLRAAGYLRARQGSGSYIALPHPSRSVKAAEPENDLIVLTCASAAAPEGLGSRFLRAAEVMPDLLRGDGYLPQGLPLLREEIAAWYERRGLLTDPRQVVVTSGALAAINLVLRTFVGLGDRVLLESPTYPAAIEAVRRSGARPVGYPVGPGRWSGEDLQLLLRQTAPRLAYLIADFHNPTAATMTAATRAAVADALRRTRTMALIDETLVQTRLDPGEQPAPFATHLAEALTVGSLAKSVWGGLRIGWIRAPLELVPALIEARSATDLGTAVVDQVVAAGLLAEPEPVATAHRDRLRRQRDLLVEQVSAILPDWQVASPAGGLSLWARLPYEASTQLAAVGEQHGVVVNAGARFFVDGGGERHVRLPFGKDPDTLREGMRRLGAAWQAVHTGQRGATSYGLLRFTA